MTTALDVIETFESMFQDKHIIPDNLTNKWLEQAIGRYNKELEEKLNFDKDLKEFDKDIDEYEIGTLAWIMMELYQSRKVSKATNIVRVVGKDVSIDGNDGIKKYSLLELSEIQKVVQQRLSNSKITAYN